MVFLVLHSLGNITIGILHISLQYIDLVSCVCVCVCNKSHNGCNKIFVRIFIYVGSIVLMIQILMYMYDIFSLIFGMVRFQLVSRIYAYKFRTVTFQIKLNLFRGTFVHCAILHLHFISFHLTFIVSFYCMHTFSNVSIDFLRIEIMYLTIFPTTIQPNCDKVLLTFSYFISSFLIL